MTQVLTRRGEDAVTAGPTRLRLLRRCALAALGGGVTAAAFAPVEQPAFAVLGPLLLFLACRQLGAMTGVAVGVSFGLTFQGALLWWLAESIGIGAWAVLSLLQALWFGPVGAAGAAVHQKRLGPVWMALAWGGVEAARSAIPLGGLPWGRLGVAVVDTPWERLLPYLGIPGTGVAVVLVAALLSRLGERLIRRPGRTVTVTTTGLVLLALAPLLLPVELDRVGVLTVSVVQGGVPGDGRQLVANHREVTRDHLRATIDLAAEVDAGEEPPPDVVVWPENSTAVDPYRDTVVRTAVESATAVLDVPLLIGAPVDGPAAGQWRNQGIVWGAAGPTGEAYTKQHPVPFGEYIPLRGILGDLSPRLAEVPRDAVAGTSTAPLDIGGVPVADAICFDIAFGDVVTPQVRAGAQLVVVQTSNASFTGTAQLDQQFTITRARALETGRAVAVASTNGVTALVAPDGQVIERAPLRTTRVLTASLPLVDTITPAVRWGPYADPTLITVVTVATIVGLGLAGRRRLSHSSRAPSSRDAAAEPGPASRPR